MVVNVGGSHSALELEVWRESLVWAHRWIAHNEVLLALVFALGAKAVLQNNNKI